MFKKLLLVIVVAAAAALAIWFGRRGGSPMISSTTVTSLLPKDTAALLLLPDVHDARAEWHKSDLYNLWREPAVQAFFEKPLAQNPTSTAASEKLQELDKLGMRDAFLAIVEAQEKQPKFVAGFRFEGKPEDVERVIGHWRNRAQLGFANGKHETQTYQQHQIELVSEGNVVVATVYDRDWFFAANDVPALQALLDRADGRVKDAASTLGDDELFNAAFKHMPRKYLAFGYARLDRYFDKLASITEDGSLRQRMEFLRQVRSAAGAISFESGKVRDVLFIGMPKVPEQGDVTRSSLALTTVDSFFYVATLLNFPDTATSPTPVGSQHLLSGFAAAGISAADWKSAFGAELNAIGDWTANARLPSLLVTLPVKDAAKARMIVRTVTASESDPSQWTRSEENGIEYYMQAPSSPMVPIATTIGISDRLLVAGLDRASVEAALTQKQQSTASLANSQLFKAAERLVPPPQTTFLYVDSALLYTRLDAAIRPMLVMAAAFMPSLTSSFDINKLPPTEVVTRHLSPIVLSQTYEKDGYIAESVGPVSIFEAGAGVLAATMAGANFYQQQFPKAIGSGTAPSRSAVPPAPAFPQASPSPTEP